MPGLAGDPDLAHSGLGRAGGEARPQRVSSVAIGCIEPGGPGPALDDQRDGLPREPPAESSVPVHGAKHRPFRDPRSGQPCRVGGGRTGRAAGAVDREHRALALLVGLRAPDREPQALGLDCDVGDIEGDEFGPAQGGGHTDEEQGAVAPVAESVADPVEDLPEPGDRQGFGVALGAPVPVAQAPHHAGDIRVAGVQSKSGHAVGHGDGREPPGQGRDRQAGLVRGEIEPDRLGRSRKGDESLRRAPTREMRGICLVGPAGVRRAGILSESGGAGSRRIERPGSERSLGKP